MNASPRPYTSDADLPAILALKQLCTTSQNLYDWPTTSDLRRLLTPSSEPRTSIEQQSREEAWRGMKERLMALWEDASGQLVAYALLAQPGSNLTFQIHPQAQGQGLEEEILAWGLVQMQARGVPRDLWCQCHAIEQEKRSVLEAAGFRPLFEPDLRLIHPFMTPLPPVSFPQGFSLKFGVTQDELDAYQELHRAVFDGMSMNMDYHQSSAYQGELDLIVVGPTGQFGAFCQCELKQVTDGQGEHLAGEVGVIGTRPELTHQGLGRALLLTGLCLLHERGATSAYLETSEPNMPAQHLFTSVGFIHLSTLQWYAKTVVPT